MATDMLAALGAVPLFEGMSKKELQAIASTGKEVDHEAGHVITEEGKTGVAFFLILEGHADVSVGGVSQRTIGPGEHFGEISLIDGGPRSATVTATEPMHLFGLTSWNFKPLLTEHPEMTHKLLLGLCKMLRVQSHT